MTSRRSSGSSRAESAVEPTRSQNITVSCRRSAVAVTVTTLGFATGSGLPSLRNAAIAPSNLRRCPTRLTPRSFRSSVVSSGNTAISIALSRKAFSYCGNPRLWSQLAMSTLARSRHGHRPRAHRTSIFGAREYSGRLGATRHHMAHHAAILARGMPINTGTGSATSALDSTGAVTGSFGPGSFT
jgi:hypothetical protein